MLALLNDIPSHDTFNRIFRFLDAEKFIACFSAEIDSLVKYWVIRPVLEQVKTIEKTNAISAIPELVAIEGCLITIDAMGCRKAITKTIVENNSLSVGCEKQPAQAAIEATLHHRLPKLYERPAIVF